MSLINDGSYGKILSNTAPGGQSKDPLSPERTYAAVAYDSKDDFRRRYWSTL